MAPKNAKPKADLSASSSLATGLVVDPVLAAGDAGTATGAVDGASNDAAPFETQTLAVADGANLNTEGVSLAELADTAKGDDVTVADTALSGTDVVDPSSAAEGQAAETNSAQGIASIPAGADVFQVGLVTIFIAGSELTDSEWVLRMQADLAAALEDIASSYSVVLGTNVAGSLGALDQTAETNTSQGDDATGEAGDTASLAVAKVKKAAAWMGIDVMDEDGEFFPSEVIIARVQAFQAEFPKLSALAKAAEAQGVTVTGIRVVSSINQLRRGGIRHPAGTTEYTDATVFEPAQVEAMLNDPALTVELI